MGKLSNFRIVLLCLGLILLPTTVAVAEEADTTVLQRDSETNRLNFSEVHQQKAGEALAGSASNSTSSLRIIGTWLLLLGVAAGGITLFYKRRYAIGRLGKNGQRLAVLERLSMGPQRELLLIKACDRLLVVGCQGNQMSMLSDLPAEDSPSQPFHNLIQNQTASDTVAGAWAGPVEVEKIAPPRSTQAPTPVSISAAYAWPDESAK